MSGTRWSAQEAADLLELYPDHENADIAAILSERYGTKRTRWAVKSRAGALGLRRAEGYRAPRESRFWTDEKRDWFVAFTPGHTEREIRAAFAERFGTELSRDAIRSAKYRFGVKSGTHGGRFEKGQESWNKGRTWDEYMSPESQERCRTTQFKKGNLPHNAVGVGIGAERVDKQGYVWVKVEERPSHHGCYDNWKLKHHIEWERANGRPVPEGSNIVFANHDKRDFKPENLVAVPRSTWSYISRAGLRYHDAESLEACINLARLRSGMRSAKLTPRKCKRCGSTFEPRFEKQRTCDTCLGRDAGEGEGECAGD